MVHLELGYEAIRSYKRLPYTPWHALAEFVDNSTQSYFSNRKLLSAALADEGRPFEVSITYDRDNDLLRIADNAMGMSLDEIEYALQIGKPPVDTSGRSKYGLGMKMAACWFGDQWTIRTKRLGATVEHEVTVEVEAVADGNNELPYLAREGLPESDHYTILEIRKLNREMRGRTLGKIRDFLSSMYRIDLRNGDMRLEWRGEPLKWDMDQEFAKARDGSVFRRDFVLDVEGKSVTGWVGVLERGSRAKAGFSILVANRVIKGWPESWRPQEIFGQVEGSNDLVNQRLTGEVHLDSFIVSHTKDNIQWMGDEEELLERALKDECAQYRDFARNRRRDPRPISDIEVQTAIEEFQAEIESPELIDTIEFTEVPPPEALKADNEAYVATIDPTEPTFSAKASLANADVEILGFLDHDKSPADPYVISESTDPNRILVIINFKHPHLEQIHGSQNLVNYFRHCTYDAIAEWQANRLRSTPDPAMIRLIKDRLLRVPFEIQMHNQ
jgi:hypothetical protein